MPARSRSPTAGCTPASTPRSPRAEELIADGAAIVDVGGESGVTGVDPLAVGEEIRRVAPLVARLVGLGMVVSVDTWKLQVARAVLAEGAHLINDVSGLRDVGLAEACAESRAGIVLMHTRAEPKRKEFPHYDDVVSDVVAFLRERIATATGLGVPVDGIVLDPGPDFAKTPAQTIEVLNHLDAVVALGRPVLSRCRARTSSARSRCDGHASATPARSPPSRRVSTAAPRSCASTTSQAPRDFLTVRAALRGEHPVDPALTLPIALRRQPPD